MFPVDTLPPAYCEAREAADEAKRLARLQDEAIKAQQAQIAKQAAQSTTPQNLTQALLQRPPLSRPGSSGFLGNIFQGFVKAASASPPQSQCSTPLPGQAKQICAKSVSAEVERIIAEQKRDADICAMPSW